MQRLIGDRADRSRAAELAAYIIRGTLALGQEQLGKALAPLLLDRDGGGEDQRPLPGAPDQLKAQYGLAAAGRCHDMKMPVFEIALRLIKDLLLIAAEAAAKDNAGKNVGHRIHTSGKTGWFLLLLYHGEKGKSIAAIGKKNGSTSTL